MGFGFLDDRRQLRARWQLVFQLVLAGVAVAGGVTIGVINNPFGGGLDRRSATPLAIRLVTVLWIVGMINSINFIDGLDGLSTGVALIAALTLGVISLTRQLQPAGDRAAVRHPGRLAARLPALELPPGAHLHRHDRRLRWSAIALAVLSILGTAKVAVALLVLGVPIIDTFWIIIRRLVARHSPFTPDRGHLHHRCSTWASAIARPCSSSMRMCGVLAVLSLVLSGTGQLTAFVGVVLILGAFVFVVTRRTADALEASAYEDEETIEAS